MLETSYPLTNADYRRLNHVDTIRAGQELRELVQTGLVDQHSTGRWTHYSLKVPGELPVSEIPKTDKKNIEFVLEHGSISNAQCRELLIVELQRASYLLKKMAADGKLRRERSHRWARYLLS